MVHYGGSRCLRRFAARQAMPTARALRGAQGLTTDQGCQLSMTLCAIAQLAGIAASLITTAAIMRNLISELR